MKMLYIKIVTTILVFTAFLIVTSLFFFKNCRYQRW